MLGKRGGRWGEYGSGRLGQDALWGLASLWVTLQKVTASAWRIFQLLMKPPRLCNGEVQPANPQLRSWDLVASGICLPMATVIVFLTISLTFQYSFQQEGILPSGS